ncbi:MAG TPA: hypothetical protein ENJ95_19465 [Bacteroidetes bacterium]|nr:hypothetical protein [Bacteroidota bacterium]
MMIILCTLIVRAYFGQQETEQNWTSTDGLWELFSTTFPFLKKYNSSSIFGKHHSLKSRFAAFGYYMLNAPVWRTASHFPKTINTYKSGLLPIAPRVQFDL